MYVYVYIYMCMYVYVYIYICMYVRSDLKANAKNTMLKIS